MPGSAPDQRQIGFARFGDRDRQHRDVAAIGIGGRQGGFGRPVIAGVSLIVAPWSARPAGSGAAVYVIGREPSAAGTRNTSRWSHSRL
jgi:hypothetical protein